jgi:hypothetical protein
MAKKDIIIKDTHRGLWYEDGVLVRILDAGRYELPELPFFQRILPEVWRRRLPKIEIALVDIRERDLTIKGQEILKADKVAIRVSIIVQFKIYDPRAALHEVESYSDRIYGDVQLIRHCYVCASWIHFESWRDRRMRASTSVLTSTWNRSPGLPRKSNKEANQYFGCVLQYGRESSSEDIAFS